MFRVTFYWNDIEDGQQRWAIANIAILPRQGDFVDLRDDDFSGVVESIHHLIRSRFNEQSIDIFLKKDA